MDKDCVSLATVCTVELGVGRWDDSTSALLGGVITRHLCTAMIRLYSYSTVVWKLLPNLYTPHTLLWDLWGGARARPRPLSFARSLAPCCVPRASSNLCDTVARVMGQAFLSHDDIRDLEGAVSGARILANIEERWVPLRLTDSVEHCLGGMVASGMAFEPVLDFAEDSNLTFDLEFPRRGDLSRVFLRKHAVPRTLPPDLVGGEPSYSDSPYLLLINDVLCMRHLPHHAIVPTLAQARAEDAWERFHIRLLPLPSETQISFALHGGDPKRPLRYDEASNRFVRVVDGDVTTKGTQFAIAHGGDAVGAETAAGSTSMRSALASRLASSRLASYLPASWRSSSATPSRGASGAVDVSDDAGAHSDLKVVNHSTAFEFVESVVTDQATGERLTHERVVYGSTRLETLVFKVRGKLDGLVRTAVSAKAFPMVGFQNVAKDIVQMGSYEGDNAEGTRHAFNMKPAKIPATPFALGRYRCTITYAAENGQGPPLRQEVVEFTVVSS